MLGIFVLLITLVIGGIYPESHFDVSTKLTVQNFDETVKDRVDQNKTFFVRWIASEGWGWWRKQAPAWNEVVQMFKSNPDVAFGDVLLSEQQIRGNHNPGAGGWPTIRYFNKKTGYEGASYKQKTKGSMCDELGNIDNMKAYIEEAGETSLCSVVTQNGCSQKEKEFIDKFSTAPHDAVATQITRLQGMSGKIMTSDNRNWLNQRLAILKQLARNVNKEEL